MFDVLPQWMQDWVPWMTWIGLFGVAATIVLDAVRRYRRLRDHKRSALDD